MELIILYILEDLQYTTHFFPIKTVACIKVYCFIATCYNNIKLYCVCIKSSTLSDTTHLATGQIAEFVKFALNIFLGRNFSKPGVYFPTL